MIFEYNSGIFEKKTVNSRKLTLQLIRVINIK